MKAFVTGSFAYGTPHQKSDMDLVVFMDKDGLTLFRDFCGEELSEAYGVEPTSASIKFGDLNLIIVSTPEEYETWRKGTEELVKRRPVTRDEAVALFSELRNKS